MPFKAIQSHRGRYKSKARMRLPNDHFYSTKECQTILSLDRRERRQINTYR